ncbi:HYR-like domain-containing protein, partial [Salegentibacter chungangensis]
MIWKTTIAKMFPFFNTSMIEAAKCLFWGSVKQTGLKLIGLMMMVSLGMQAQNGNNPGEETNNIIVGDDCIEFISCPADQTVCADSYNDEGLLGAEVTWDTAVSTQTCTGTGSEGNFQMLFELNEELLSQDCWDFNYIQRVGTQGGYVKLFSSNDQLGTEQSIITTPYLILNNGSETSIELNYDNGNYTVQLFLVDEAGNEYPSGGPTPVNGNTTVYEFTTQLPTGSVGVYRIKYVFDYTGAKPSNANTGDTVIAVDGILYDDGCSGGVDFTVTGPSQGFYPVGSHDLVYKATYTAPDGSTKTKTCSFNITVSALDVQITNVQDASCNTSADGSITAQASGVNGTGTEPFEYSINGTDFQPDGTFTALSPGIYNITAKDANGCAFVSGDVNVEASDTEAPVLTPPADDTVEGCDVSDITSLPYSETATEISVQEFENIGGSISDNGTIASITYQDSNNASFPVLVTRVFTVNDACGNSVHDSQTITIEDNTAPVPDAASLPTVTGQCSATVSNVPTATDNCNGSINGTTTDPLTYSEQGTYTIVWTFTDSEGNSSTQNQTVIIDDTTAPVADAASLPTVTGQCNATVSNVPTATDNCNGSINGTTTDPLSYSNQGTYTIDG